MATNKAVSSQTVTLIYLTPADSRRVNLRHQDIRQVGIYSGMYLTNPSGLNLTLSLGVCEISDGNYQVRVSTGAATTAITPSDNATEYVILYWNYTGDEDADVLNVQTVSAPAADGNDIVVAKITTSGGAVTAIDYNDATYPRTQPNTLDLFLKVEPTADTELYVRIRAGRIQTNAGVVTVADQKSSLFDETSLTTGQSRIDLVHITDAGVVTITKGTAAASPSTPAYDGKRVLAEVTITDGDANIAANAIKDVRNFITLPTIPDDSTIERNSSSGALSLKHGQSDSDITALTGGDITLSLYPAADTVIGTVSMTTTGGDVHLSCFAVFGHADAARIGELHVSLDDVEIGGIGVNLVAGDLRYPISVVSLSKSLAAGTYTFTAVARNRSGVGTVKVRGDYYYGLIVTELPYAS